MFKRKLLLFFVLCFLTFPTSYTYAQSCGVPPSTWEAPGPCVASSTIANGCAAPRVIYPVTTECVDREGSCMFDTPTYQGCRPGLFPYTNICVTQSGSGGWAGCDEFAAPPLPNNNFDYIRCPSGTALSCGSSAEAADQNKTFCGYRITCNKYYWPSNITVPAPCNQNNPVSATCNFNCSCCATGTSRTCIQGSAYIKSITREVCAQGDNECNVARSVALVTCNTHDDIFVFNKLVKKYENRWGDKLEDWNLICRVNTCKCITSTYRSEL